MTKHVVGIRSDLHQAAIILAEMKDEVRYFKRGMIVFLMITIPTTAFAGICSATNFRLFRPAG